MVEVVFKFNKGWILIVVVGVVEIGEVFVGWGLVIIGVGIVKG